MREGRAKSLVCSRRERRLLKLLPPAQRWELIGPDTSVGQFYSISSASPWSADPIESKLWPIHCPPDLTLIPWHTIWEVQADSCLTAEERAQFAYLWDYQVYAVCATVSPGHQSSNLTPTEMQEILASGVFEHCYDPVGTGYAFLVSEHAKRRRRLVHDTLTANVLLHDAPNPRFRSLNDLKRCIHRGTYAASIDMRAFYFQFQLHAAVRRFFPIKVGDQFYQPTRCCMGFKASVSIAQSFMRVMVRRAGIADDECDIYIDNVAIWGSVTRVRQAYADLLRVLRSAGVEVGAVSEGPTIEHRGMVMNFEQKLVNIKPSFVAKLAQRVAVSTGSWAQLRSLIGMVTYGLQVLGVPLGSIFHVFKFWVRHIHTPVSTKVELWHTSQIEWNEALRQIMDSVLHDGVPVMPEYETDTFVVTDASLQGGAGVTAGILVIDGRIEWFSTPGHRCSDIATLETMAVLEAVRRWPKRLRHHGIMFLSDNAVTLAGLARGLSANYGVNECVKAILRLFIVCKIQPVLVYIPSVLNPADPLTRDFVNSFAHDDVMRTLRHWSTRGVPGGVELVRFFAGSNLPVFRWA